MKCNVPHKDKTKPVHFLPYNPELSRRDNGVFRIRRKPSSVSSSIRLILSKTQGITSVCPGFKSAGLLIMSELASRIFCQRAELL